MTLQTFRDGERYDVRHPEMAMLTRSSILVGVDAPDDGVTAIEPLAGAAGMN